MVIYLFYHHQTVDAEITSGKTTQRARDAENRVRNCLANGPRRVQSKAFAKYSATHGHASAVPGYDSTHKRTALP